MNVIGHAIPAKGHLKFSGGSLEIQWRVTWNSGKGHLKFSGGSLEIQWRVTWNFVCRQGTSLELLQERGVSKCSDLCSTKNRKPWFLQHRFCDKYYPCQSFKNEEKRKT